MTSIIEIRELEQVVRLVARPIAEEVAQEVSKEVMRSAFIATGVDPSDPDSISRRHARDRYVDELMASGSARSRTVQDAVIKWALPGAAWLAIMGAVNWLEQKPPAQLPVSARQETPSKETEPSPGPPVS